MVAKSLVKIIITKTHCSVHSSDDGGGGCSTKTAHLDFIRKTIYLFGWWFVAFSSCLISDLFNDMQLAINNENIVSAVILFEFHFMRFVKSNCFSFFFIHFHTPNHIFDRSKNKNFHAFIAHNAWVIVFFPKGIQVDRSYKRILSYLYFSLPDKKTLT